jgi:hypothetical protein
MRHEIIGAHFTGQDNQIGGRQGFNRDTRITLAREERIQDTVRDPVTDLIRMTLRDGFAGENIRLTLHLALPV